LFWLRGRGATCTAATTDAIRPHALVQRRSEEKKSDATQPKLKTKPPPPKHNRHDHHTNNNSTVADGTCSFPSNMFGCESAAKGITGGGVKFLAEDRALECEGKDAGKCASRATFTAN
jgi:hypothetical protein